MGFVGLLCGRIDTYSLLALSNPLELNDAVGESKQGIVASDTDVASGMNSCSALPNKNASCCHKLSAKAFYTQTLGIAVTAVA